MPSTETWREYQVSPRYLAGSTFTGDPAIQPLMDAGWNRTFDEYGNGYITSPDQRIRVGYLPEGEDDALWKIMASPKPFHGGPSWLITYQDSAPTEIVADLTTTLADLHSTDPEACFTTPVGDLALLDAATPLAASGWSHSRAAGSTVFRSPDMLVRVELERGLLHHDAEMLGTSERWYTRAGTGHRDWYATASSNTPAVLVAAMHTALADTGPVLREEHDLVRLHARATVVQVPPPRPTPRDMQRAVAARSRSTVRPASAGRQLGLSPNHLAPSILVPATPAPTARSYR